MTENHHGTEARADGAGTSPPTYPTASRPARLVIVSNRLPFTVRPGRIFFVKTSGSDATGNGTWQRPWRSLLKAKDSLAPGDIAYLGDGVSQLTETAFGAAVNLGSDGSPEPSG